MGGDTPLAPLPRQLSGAKILNQGFQVKKNSSEWQELGEEG